MSEYQYNKVTPEMIEKFKEIAPKRVLVGDEINEDFIFILFLFYRFPYFSSTVNFCNMLSL